MGAALRFKTISVPRQQGERARMKVLRGPDHGATYVVTGGKATIGRGEDNDIVLSDLKASRNHAEIAFTQNGWTVRDLSSANGILLNGKAARSGNLNVKDTVTIGETVLEFVTADQETMMLVAPVRSLEQVQAEQSALEAQKKRVHALGKVGGLAQPKGQGGAAQKQDPKRLIILAVLGLGGALLLFGPDDKSPQKRPAKSKDNVVVADLDKYLPGAENSLPGTAKSSDVFFRNGFREYRQGNWVRARTQFETVLQMSPGHSLAQLYLTNCENKIKEEVKAHIETGKKSYDSGKLKDARGHFEAVMRLLFRDQTNPAYIEASEQLEKVVKDMRTEVSR